MSNRHRLDELWNTFGLYISLPESEWAELDPVVDRLPPLDLAKPAQIDHALAEAVLARQFSSRGEEPRPIRWFPDAQSARAYEPAVSFLARAAFPCTDAPSAWAAAWDAGSNAEDWFAERSRIEAELKRKYPRATTRNEIGSRAGLLELFAAGCFYYWIGPEEVVLIARPALWLEGWKLHREDGPGVAWPPGEQYFFWRGVHVPAWIIEHPQRLSPQAIRNEPDLARRYAMIERFGPDRYTAAVPARERIMERWNDWQQCYSIADFGITVRTGIEAIFQAVSQRLLAYAQASIDRLTPEDFQNPSIDRDAVGQALRRFLREWDEPMRPLRWFDDAASARAYVGERGTARAAHWPKLAISRQFDAAWYTGGFSRGLHPNIPWLEAIEDWNVWTIAVPRARDCHDREIIERRTARLEHWSFARRNWSPDKSATVFPHEPVPLSDPVIARWTPLIDAFAAGLFYYWIGADEIVCIPRPSLSFDSDRLHRADGPAVAWPTGEAYYFWRGVDVPRWMIEQPSTMTVEQIRAETNLELRRCMVELFGQQRFLREGGARLIVKDECGKLWEPDQARVDHLLLEVTNGTAEPDGTRRVYFLRVPPQVTTPREAVAWTYGLSEAQYRLAVRT